MLYPVGTRAKAIGDASGVGARGMDGSVGRRGEKRFVLPVHAVNTVDADDAIRSIGIDGGDTTRVHCAGIDITRY